MIKMRNLHLFLIMLLFAGCSSTDWTDPETGNSGAVINVTIQKSRTKANTEVGNDQENSITHLAFYIFKKSGSLEKKYEFKDTGIASDKAYSMLCTSGEKYVYVIANAPAFYEAQEPGIKYTDFALRYTTKQSTNPVSPFVMSGKYRNAETNDLLRLLPNPDNTPSTANIEIALDRLAGKVTVTGSSAVTAKFELKSFRIVNANPYAYYFKQSNSIKLNSFAEEIDPNNEAAFNNWSGAYYLDNYPQTLPDEAAYAFENWNEDPRRGNTTCIIIGGIYKGVNPANTTITYYRFNLGGKDVKWAFNRNTHYKVQITHVYEDGYSTEKDAEEATPDGKPTDPLLQDVQISATITIEPWNIVDQSGDIGKE